MEKNKNSRFKKTVARLMLVASVLCVIIISVLFAFPNQEGRIARGIMVCGTDISDMTEIEAEKALLGTGTIIEQDIVIHTKSGKKVTLRATDIGLERSCEKTVQRAYAVGRGGNAIENFRERLSLYLAPKDIGYACIYDKDRLTEILYSLGMEVNGERKDYIIDYKDKQAYVKRGTAGQSKNVDGAIADFNYAVGRRIYNICVSFERELPRVPDALSLYEEIYTEPKDAYYEIKAGRVVMIPEVVGRQIDIKEAETQVERLARGETIELSTQPVMPEVTLEILSKNLFNYTLGTYSTSYATSTAARKANVELAARKINGVILAPGEVFSYNKVVGPRTRAAGFRDAPMYANGETVEGVGGGICQVSSTLYSAVLYADLKIVKRQNHSMTVAYVPRGQDATVSYGTIDFRFKNDTAYPIKVLAGYSGGKLTVSILGTKPQTEKTVKIINNTIETKTATVEEEVDETLPVGTRKTISTGKTGYTVDTLRIVTENGIEVKRENMGRSRYKMVPTKVKIGAMQKVEVAEPQPSESASVSVSEETEQVFAEESSEVSADAGTGPEVQDEIKTESD